MRRRGILQAWTGREAFARTVLGPGPARTVGTADADHVVHPERGGGPQFSVVWDGVAAHVLSVEPHEVTINGLPAWPRGRRGVMRASAPWLSITAAAAQLLAERSR